MAYKGNNNNNNNRSNGNNQTFKKSGAKYSTIAGRNGLYIVNAWNKSKKGLLVAKVFPYHASVDKNDNMIIVESKTGKQYIKMLCELDYRSSGQKRLIPCLMNIETHVIVLKDVGMTITPNGHGKTSSGKTAKGYFGTFSG